MSQVDYQELTKLMHEIDIDPEKTLFLFNEAQDQDPYIKIPLGSDKQKDGWLVICEDGWFLFKEGDKRI